MFVNYLAPSNLKCNPQGAMSKWVVSRDCQSEFLGPYATRACLLKYYITLLRTCTKHRTTFAIENRGKMQQQYRAYAQQQVPQRSPHVSNQRRGGIGEYPPSQASNLKVP